MTVIPFPGAEVVSLTAPEAEKITSRIRSWVKECPIDDIKRAYFGRVWLAMGYESWSEWCDCELDGFKLPAIERRGTVSELAESGMSNRAIADVTGVSEGTVRNDKAGAQNYAPGPVVGQDGKTYKRKPVDDDAADTGPRCNGNSTPDSTGKRQPALEKWDESSWDCEKINESKRLVKMNDIMWDALDGLDEGIEGKMLVRLGQSILDLVGDENKVRGIARMMHSLIEFASAYKTQRPAPKPAPEPKSDSGAAIWRDVDVLNAIGGILTEAMNHLDQFTPAGRHKLHEMLRKALELMDMDVLRQAVGSRQDDEAAL